MLTKKRGRPPKAVTRERRLVVRVSEEELEKFKEEARKRDISTSEYVRRYVMRPDLLREQD